MPDNKYKLISFVICPFVQRSIVVLNHKKQDYDIEYIDIENPPEWYLKKVPTGKVPALFIGDDVIFESAIINEFIDETCGTRLMPEEPLQRAKERSWIAYSEQLIFDQYGMMTADNAESFNEKKAYFFQQLLKLETEVGKNYFNGENFSLIDASIAPIFTRLTMLPSLYDDFKEKLNIDSNLIGYIQSLSSSEDVSNSVTADFEEHFLSYFNNHNSYCLKSF
ncbi:hypothetical protein MNBD_GAMMA06-1017 [hydrothermal vent metagenome]|uniref:Glutathione S-transferase n=1 Tax=hydrothermal vent metagenome TaxID=652676 RepID=A0A3B0WFK2_9ZZZZ